MWQVTYEDYDGEEHPFIDRIPDRELADRIARQLEKCFGEGEVSETFVDDRLGVDHTLLR